MKLSAALLAAGVVLAAAAARAQVAPGDVFGDLTTCRDLGLDDPFWDVDGAGNYKYLTEGAGAARLALLGVTVTVSSRTNQAIVFPTANPTGGDIDLGAPNRLCDWDDVPGASPYCFKETVPADAVTAPALTLHESFVGHASNDVPYVNCSETSCPGDGCGGARWLSTPGTRNGDGDECEPELTDTLIELTDGSVITVQCPLYNPFALCVPQGNVLVVQELGRGADVPDDEQKGGTITVTFDRPVTPITLSVVDVDFGREAGTVRMYDSDDNLLDDLPLAAPGNAGFDSNFLGDPNVRRIEIELSGSGSINDIQWCIANSSIEATPSWTRTCEWDILKSVEPASHNLLVGNDDTSAYTVEVSKECTDSLSVCTEARTTAPSPLVAAEIASVCVKLDESAIVTSAHDYNVTLDLATDCECRTSEDDSESFGPCELNGDGSTTIVAECNGVDQCEIRCSACLDVDDNTDLAVSFEFMATERSRTGDFKVVGSVDFPDVPDSITDNEAVVSDSEGAFATFTTDEATNLTFDGTFACTEKEQPDSRHNCTATVTPKDSGNAKDSEVSVLLQCVDPTVAKTASTSFRRCYDWSVEKSASSPNQADGSFEERCTEIFFNDSFTSEEVTWNFEVTATPREDNFEVSGTISVSNPHPSQDAVGASLTDTFEGTSLAIDCDGSGGGADSFTVPAGTTVTCTYSGSFATRPSDDENEAALSFAGHSYGATAAVDFGDSPSSTCNDGASAVDVFASEPSDSTDLGTFTASSSSAETFTPAPITRTLLRQACPEHHPGEVLVETLNTVTLTTTDGLSTNSTWKVTTHSPCEECPCEYEGWPGDVDPEGNFCVEVTGPPTGICLCWTPDRV